MTKRTLLSLASGLFLLVAVATFAWSAGEASSTSATAIAAGSGHDCMIGAAGGLQCWGNNESAQLGLGYWDVPRHNSPEYVPGLSSGVSAVAVDERYSCALAAGAVSCWGDNTWGQMGNGTNIGCCNSPTGVTTLSSGVAAIDTGQFHACAVMTGGGIKCWGTNSSGQTGDGSTPTGQILPPVNVVGISDGVAVTSGGRHSCALLAAGSVKCWGLNAFGQLGNNTTADSATPVDVLANASPGDPLVGIVAISAGWGHTCALTSSGGAKCWGLNSDGQLGNGTTVDSSLPVDVTSLSSGVAAISGGAGHTCALTTGGGAKCWGSNANGELGIGFVIPPPDGTMPVDVGDLPSGATAIAAGYLHACAIVSSDVKCWGDGYSWTPTSLSKTPAPTATASVTPTVTLTPTTTPTPFVTKGTILVSSENKLYEYTTAGVQLTVFEGSYNGGAYPPTEYMRDIATNGAGDIVTYNGTFSPYLSTLDVWTGTWTHVSYAGWDTVNGGDYGGIAVFAPYVYVSDMATSGAGSPNGIVRFGTSDGEQRFAVGTDFIDLAAGLDGLLYALHPGGSPSGMDVNVYDPLSMTLLRTIDLDVSLRGIAVNEAGEMFGVDWDDRIVRVAADGSISQSIASGVSDPYDIDVSPDGLLAVGSRFGAVAITDESLPGVQNFSVGGSGTFVAFAGVALPKPATPTPTASATETPGATQAHTPSLATKTATPTTAKTATASATPTTKRTSTATVTPTKTAPPPTATPTPQEPAPTATKSPKPATATPTVGKLAGDVTCNGVVNSIDALVVLQLVGGLLHALPCPGNADVRVDGVVNAMDAALILQYVAGRLASLP